MKGIFDLSSKEFCDFNWAMGAFKGYAGPLITNGKSISVNGGFGNMLFEKVSVPLFDL